MGKFVSKYYIAYTVFTAINVVLECMLYVFYLRKKFHTSILLVNAANSKHLVSLTQFSYIYTLFMV